MLAAVWDFVLFKHKRMGLLKADPLCFFIRDPGIVIFINIDNAALGKSHVHQNFLHHLVITVGVDT